MLESHVLQRLAFIRYGYTLAIDQSQLPEPMSAYSLLGLHDAVELFLQLATEHLNVDKKNPAFMEYWDIIDPKLAPDRLGQKAAMRRINNARVALKHHGNLPSQSQIEQFRAIVTAFFDESTTQIFDLHFSEISMIDLVPYEAPRMSLREAEMALSRGQNEAAMSSIAIAFDQLMHEINQGYFDRYFRSPFNFGEDFRFESAFFRRSGGIIEDARREKFEDKLVKAVESMQSAVQILSLGLDYRRYAKFSLLTPVAFRMLGGSYEVQVVQGLVGSIDWPPTTEACRFCLDFVIESAVRIRGTDISSTTPTSSPKEDGE